MVKKEIDRILTGICQSRTVVDVELPMPPTSNKIYRNIPGKGRALTKEAYAWRTRAVNTISKSGDLVLNKFSLSEQYGLYLVFKFSDIQNKGWEKGKSSSKWKRIDLSNRIKLLEDAIKYATGIDDSSTFVLFCAKTKTVREPSVNVSLRCFRSGT